ncbi:hypothetical protein EGW08_023305 [Elysia chlorotica]|uniref:Uncharacterized protein n=1 Tax=Elysia chlorotica TaxID=188477 RepID=A0A3S1AW81_ELYCH|nr:hypothetical protein EGW08_023305 [Elysia chlorotica]
MRRRREAMRSAKSYPESPDQPDSFRQDYTRRGTRGGREEQRPCRRIPNPLATNPSFFHRRRGAAIAGRSAAAGHRRAVLPHLNKHSYFGERWAGRRKFPHAGPRLGTRRAGPTRNQWSRDRTADNVLAHRDNRRGTGYGITYALGQRPGRDSATLDDSRRPVSNPEPLSDRRSTDSLSNVGDRHRLGSSRTAADEHRSPHIYTLGYTVQDSELTICAL